LLRGASSWKSWWSVLTDAVLRSLSPRLCEENRRSIQQKLSQLEVILVTPAIADRFGVVKAQPRSRGRSKADFDLMIGATALELGATLVTDDCDLLGGDIGGLRVDNWVG